MATVFDKILDSTTGKKSYDWYRKKVQSMTTPTARTLINQGKATLRPKYGVMNLFGYDPKHKETLPYYDTFPLVIVVKPAKGGFLGLNLHYLPPTLRAMFLDALMDNVTSKKSDDAKFDLTVRLLAGTSKLRYYEPCIKHYLNAHVKSKFAEVKAPEWEIATFLPTAQFQKASNTKVYADSRKMI